MKEHFEINSVNPEFLAQSRAEKDYENKESETIDLADNLKDISFHELYFGRKEILFPEDITKKLNSILEGGLQSPLFFLKTHPEAWKEAKEKELLKPAQTSESLKELYKILSKYDYDRWGTEKNDSRQNQTGFNEVSLYKPYELYKEGMWINRKELNNYFPEIKPEVDLECKGCKERNLQWNNDIKIEIEGESIVISIFCQNGHGWGHLTGSNQIILPFDKEQESKYRKLFFEKRITANEYRGFNLVPKLIIFNYPKNKLRPIVNFGRDNPYIYREIEIEDGAEGKQEKKWIEEGYRGQNKSFLTTHTGQIGGSPGEVKAPLRIPPRYFKGIMIPKSILNTTIGKSCIQLGQKHNLAIYLDTGEIYNSQNNLEKDFDVLNFDKAQFKDLFKQFNSQELVNFFKKNPELENAYNFYINVSNRLTVEKHTLLCMDRFEKYFGTKNLPGGVDKNLFRILLALSEVGYSKTKENFSSARNKEIFYDASYIDRILNELDYPDQEIRMVLALLSAKSKLDIIYPEYSDMQGIAELSKKTSLSSKEFFELLLIYDQVTQIRTEGWENWENNIVNIHDSESRHYLKTAILVFDQEKEKMDYAPLIKKNVQKLISGLDKLLNNQE